MSATGQGGVSVIAGANHGQLTSVTIPSGGTLTFTHNQGRRAYQVLVTNGTSGALVPETVCLVAQATDDAITVQNLDEGDQSVYVACRWENLTEELDLVRANDSRIVIEDG